MQGGGFMWGGAWRRLSPAVLVGLLALSLPPVAAHAVTDVSGEMDSNAPLIIDPSTDPVSPLSTTGPASGTVMVVQRMPVTKIVDEVTLGDLAVGPGCSSGTASAKVEESDSSGGAIAQFYSQGSTAISTTPSKLAWGFSPITMRKGRNYAFRVSVSGCSNMTRTLWPHNEAQVNPGPLACTSGPQGWKRMWHESGQDDAVAGCVDFPAGQRAFKANMPTGWLISDISQTGSNQWDVVTTGGGGTPPCYTPYWPNTYDTYGGTPAFWETSTSFPYHPKYACKWTQWASYDAPANQLPEHGWYYAQPWLAGTAAGARDMYLKLGIANYDALLEAHVPILRYDTDEDFHALSPGAATDFYDASDSPDDPDDANRLLDGNGVFASANPWVAFDQGLDTLTLGYLATSYTGLGPRGGTAADMGDFISERGNSDYANDATYMEALPGYAHRVYGRVAHGNDGKVWLQYWLFYYYDPQSSFGFGVHEGDWEMVQVGLDSSNNPDMAAYAQHGDGERCAWATDVESDDGRPVVYVARGSHAAYFEPGHYDDPQPDDDADGAGIEVGDPALVQVRTDTPSWVAWPGRWGDSGAASPRGPAYQSGGKWSDPTAWADSLSNCDVG